LTRYGHVAADPRLTWRIGKPSSLEDKIWPLSDYKHTPWQGSIFLTKPKEESTMTEPAPPKLNRPKYPAMLLCALAVAATPLAYLAIAGNELAS